MTGIATDAIAWRTFLTALQNSLHLVSKIKAASKQSRKQTYFCNGLMKCFRASLEKLIKIFKQKQTGVVYLQVSQNITMNNCLLLTVLIPCPCSTGCTHQAESLLQVPLCKSFSPVPCFHIQWLAHLWSGTSYSSDSFNEINLMVVFQSCWSHKASIQLLHMFTSCKA